MSEPVAAASALAPSLVVRLMPWWSRTIAGVAGAALGVFGVLAVFRADSDIGATALLLLGTFFVLVAVLGHVPRVRVGGNELDSAFAYGVGKKEGAGDVVHAVELAAAEERPALQGGRGPMTGRIETREGPGARPTPGGTMPPRPSPAQDSLERVLNAARGAEVEAALDAGFWTRQHELTVKRARALDEQKRARLLHDEPD